MSTTQDRLARLLIDAIRYAETTYDRDGSGEVSGGDVEPAFVTEGVALLREFGFPIDVRPVPPDAVELLHGLVETLANAYRGYLPHLDPPKQPVDELLIADVRTRLAFIQDCVKKADAIRAQVRKK